MAMSGGKDDGEPMMEMNTTPLIDVMLVLLIMFIITIPIQTHAVKVDLPVDDPNQKNNPPPILPDINKVAITPQGVILWNATPIDMLTLRQYLDRTRDMDPEPELHFQPDPQARYDTVDRVLSIIRKSEVTKMGFVGNEQYANF